MKRVKCARWTAAVAWMLAIAPAQATTFAVLLQGTPDETCEIAIDPPPAGESAEMYRPSMIELVFPALPGTGPFELTFTDELASRSVVPTVPGSYVFELIVTDANGTALSQLGGEAVFGFQYDARSAPGAGDACLGYLDERNPPKWECQDSVLEDRCSGRDGFYCGTTDHLTLFSIGPVPEPSSAALLGAGLALLGRRRRIRVR